MKLKTFLTAMALAMPIAAMPGLAHAEEAAAAEEPTPAWDLSGEIGLASDYRFRGLSLSGKEPEIMATATIAHESGIYASAWASNVELGSGKADDLEVDWTLGYSRDIGNITLDVGGIYYSYLGNHTLNYVEAYGSIGTKVGPADVKVGVAYAPSQDNIGNRDNTYVYVSGEVPLGKLPLSLHGTFGYEHGAFGDHKKDWIIGVGADLGSGFSATLDYVDTAHSLSTNGEPAVVGSIKFGF